MEIVAPLNSIEDIKSYLELGVSEIYLGLNIDKRGQKWNSTNERFESKASINIETLKEIKKLNLRAKKSAKLSLTLNRSFYTQQQLAETIKQIKETKNLIDNYIVADPSIIELVKKYAPDKEITLSCIGVCLNSCTAKFYKEKGVKKIVLPRHLTLEEIKEIIREAPELEYEVMILNQFCRNVDGYCFRCHIPESEIYTTTCNIPFNYKIISENKQKIETVKENIGTLLKKFNPFCGICALKELERIGVNFVKIVGRNNHNVRKTNDVKFIQKAISIPDKNNKEECKKLFTKYYQFKCKNNCYY